MTFLEMCEFNYMFITKVIVKAVLDYITLLFPIFCLSHLHTWGGQNIRNTSQYNYDVSAIEYKWSNFSMTE